MEANKPIKNRFLKLIEGLIEKLELDTRLDIRDRIAALALIDRVLAREKDDDSAAAGSAVRKYQPAFKTADGAGRRAADRGSNGDNGEGVGDTPASRGYRGIDTGERPDEPDEDSAG